MAAAAKPQKPQKPQDPVAVGRSLILKARTDPVWFAREVLRLKRLKDEKAPADDPSGSWELDPWQVELLEAAGDVVRASVGQPTKVNHAALPLITVRACQGPGKTFGAAMLLHWFMFCFPGLAVCTAPKLSQVTTRLFREFIKIGGRAIPGYSDSYDVGGRSIRWKTAVKHQEKRWLAIAETGRNPESMQGFHEKYLLCICDEASGVPDEIFAAVRGSMSTGRIVILLMIGNPTRSVGAFAESHRRVDLAGDYFRMHISHENSSRVSPAWVEQMARQYGTSSPVYKVRVLGQFAETSEGQLIAAPWLVSARERELPDDGSLPFLRVAVDVADGGTDETVFSVCRHYDTHVHVLKIIRRSYEPGDGPIAAGDEAARLFRAWGGINGTRDDIVVDGLGVGAGCVGYLRKFGMPVIRYVGGEASDEPSMWRNRRVQSYLAMRDAFRDQYVTFADDACDTPAEWSDMEAQLCMIRRAQSQERLEDLVTKADLKREGLKSPDIADALAMQFMSRRPVEVMGEAITRLEMPAALPPSFFREYAV